MGWVIDRIKAVSKFEPNLQSRTIQIGESFNFKIIVVIYRWFPFLHLHSYDINLLDSTVYKDKTFSYLLFLHQIGPRHLDLCPIEGSFDVLVETQGQWVNSSLCSLKIMYFLRVNQAINLMNVYEMSLELWDSNLGFLYIKKVRNT